MDWASESLLLSGSASVLLMSEDTDLLVLASRTYELLVALGLD